MSVRASRAGRSRRTCLGNGREFEQAVLERGAGAVARNTDSLADLLVADGEAMRLVEPGGFATVRSGRADLAARGAATATAAGLWLRRR
ncbi:hypothetical protein [Streptomyces longisporus]